MKTCEHGCRKAYSFGDWVLWVLMVGMTAPLMIAVAKVAVVEIF